VIVFLALLPGYILSIFYRSFLSVIAAPVMADLDIGPAEFGLLGATWFVTFALAQFPVGWALDQVGPKRTVLTAMAVGSVGAILFALATRFELALLAMMLIGIGCSPVFMAALYLFARTEAPARFGVLASLFIGIGSSGNLAGAAPLAWAAVNQGWRFSMLIVGGSFVFATFLAGVLLRDPPQAEARSLPQEGLLQGLRSIVRIRPLWLLALLTMFSYAIIVTVRGLWVAPFMSQVYGFDGIASGQTAFAMAIAMTVAAFAYGALERAYGEPKTLVALGTGATVLGFAGLATVGDTSPLVATVLFSAVGFTGFTYALLMAHARMFFPSHLLGRGMTAVNFLFISGAALVQALSGWFIAAQLADGLAPAATFARLHWAFALTLGLALAIYLFAPARAEAAR
jgi:predicted MFS family arabinose efflux permease